VTPQEFLDLQNEKALPKWEFIDLHAQQRSILPSLERRMRAVLRHGQYILGPEVGELEVKLADFAGIKHAIACASGTDALLLALMAYGVGPGDAVFTTPFTFVATAEPISLLGAVPVYVDIDPVTFNMDPQKLERAIQAVRAGDRELHPLPASGRGAAKEPTPSLNPRGVIPVDLFGLPADYDAIVAIARKYGLFVIEDGAQSFGAVYRERRAGSLGDVAAVSFFPAKPLGGYGDGGAVLTDDTGLAEKMISLRVHGKGEDRYDNVRIGINGRLDTLQAAVLLSKMEVLEEELGARQKIAERYEKLLSPMIPAVIPPRIPKGLRSAWAQYSILSERRGEIQAGFQRAKIPTAIYYPKPLHLQTAFAYLGYRSGDFPVSENAARRILSVPMHPYLTEAQISKIVDVIGKAIARS
jgi:UDP-2-acetamido-2-deoxy-ribo-hexuluronate aminotransferase